ncbi:flippase [Patescibacteria group bacterium]|nr:flippase [Patescibacteria group bacterium]MBU1721348.1 flippase [Patescibacteria group bacterium]MBU1901556.1 flippase [Patescibacteria group bacterium]
MSIQKKIVHNAAAQVVGKIISTILGLVAVIMLTRYLGVEQYGWYTTVISFLGFAGVVVDFGMLPLTSQITSERPDGMDEHAFKKHQHYIFNNLFSFRLVTAGIFFLVIPLLAWLFPYPLQVKIAISFTSIAFFAISMNLVSIGWYQTVLKTHLQAIGEIIGRLVLVAGIWIMIAFNAPFLPVMGAITLSNVAYGVFLLYSTNKMIKIRLVYDKVIWKNIYTKMWPIALSIMFNVVYLRGDTLILAHYYPQTEVGLYGAAYRVIDIVSQLGMMIMGLLLPLLATYWSKNMKEAFEHFYQQAFNVMMMMALPVVAGGIIASRSIILLFSEEYLGAVAPLSILLLCIPAVYIGAMFGHIAVAMNKQKATIWIFGSNAILTIIGYFYFIPRYGMQGAAWMTVFSECYTAIFLFLVIQKHSKVKLSFQTLQHICLSTIAMAGVIYFVQNLHIFFILPIAAIVYIAFLYFTRVLTKEFILDIVKKTPQE